MCVSPVIIRNPRMKGGTFDSMLHPLYMRVPCGKCYQCLMSKQNEWVVRNIYEFKYRQGDVYYYTLTYNEGHLPVIIGEHGERIEVFSRKVFQKFMKRLRLNLSTYGISCRYFVTSERGGLRCRPHHHIIFYLSRSISPFTFKKLVESSWQQGFIKSGDNLGFVNSPAALMYCCKYLTKDGRKTNLFKSVKKEKSFCKLASYLSRKFDAFRLSSQGFGASGINDVTDKMFETNVIQMPVLDKVKKFPVPQYFKRKLFYDKYKNSKGNVCFKLNERGFSLLDSRFAALVQSLKNSCSAILSQTGWFIDENELLDTFVCSFIPKENYRDFTPYLNYKRRFRLGKFDSPTVKYNDLYLGNQPLLLEFNNFKAQFAYEKYKEDTLSYNVAQRVKYRHPKLLTLLTYKEYVNTA